MEAKWWKLQTLSFQHFTLMKIWKKSLPSPEAVLAFDEEIIIRKYFIKTPRYQNPIFRGEYCICMTTRSCFMDMAFRHFLLPTFWKFPQRGHTYLNLTLNIYKNIIFGKHTSDFKTMYFGKIMALSKMTRLIWYHEPLLDTIGSYVGWWAPWWWLSIFLTNRMAFVTRQIDI